MNTESKTIFKSGREEHDQRIKNRIANYISELPKDEAVLLKQFVAYRIDSSPITNYNYIRLVKQFIQYIKSEKGINNITYENLNAVLPLDINAFISKHNIIIKKIDGIETETKSTSGHVAMIWNAINSFYSFLFNNELVNKNPCAKTTCPKNTDLIPQDNYLIPEQIQDMILKSIIDHQIKAIKEQGITHACFQYRDALIIKLLFTTGSRCAALTQIKLEDIDLDNMSIKSIGKGEKQFFFYFNEELKQDIIKWIQKRQEFLNYHKAKDCGYLFISNHKTKMSDQSVNLMVKKYSKMVGKEITTHGLRHSFASALDNQGESIYFISQMLGHQSVKTTQRYINTATVERRREATTNLLGSI